MPGAQADRPQVLERRTDVATAGPSGAEAQLVSALRAGDQAAFTDLVRRLHPGMVRVATSYVSSRAVAEEVVQDTWLAVLESLERFEGRSTLKTWIFRILVNQAKSRGVRERRTLPFSAISVRSESEGTAVPAERFLEDGHRWAGHWAGSVRVWQVPEDSVVEAELGALIRQTIDRLPPAQGAVVALRDGQGLSAEEVCDLLGLSAANQRVLLHRGRARVRAAIGGYIERDEVAT
jgi:RNA polymerase sigma-70 factor (ECF subfamily)